MKAIIFAAGIGKRLQPLTKDIPKALLKYKDKTIIEHQIELLNKCGINDIVMVVGHGAEKVRALLGDKVVYVYNPKYNSANNIYSQWVARNEIRGNDCLFLHADALFHKDILDQVIEHKGDVCLSVQKSDKKKMIRVKAKNGLITEINKPIPFNEAYGNFIGIVKCSAKTSTMLIDETKKLIDEGNLDAYSPFPINRLIKKGVKVHPVVISDLPWCDIDDKDDLEKAQKDIFPLICPF